MALKPGQRLGAFEVVAALGSGGMGEVYRARDARLGRDVAVKVLPESLSQDPDRLVRLEQEARTLAHLNHPNIAVVYGLEDHHGTTCLVMELVPGLTLDERLSQGPLPRREALAIARQVAEALEGAHAAGIIHRDLKPSNVKLTPEGRVKLLDFGLAKALGAAANSPTGSPTTHEGVILGTGAYMSPEQINGRELGTRTDVWSFGCLLYELLTGRKPFQADTLSNTLVAILERDPDWSALPSTTPPAVRSLVQRCLQKDMSRRMHDIADARIELEEALAAPGPASVPPIVVEDHSRRWWRSPAAVAALLLVLSVLAGLAAAQWFRSRAPSSQAPSATVTLAVLPFHVLAGSPEESALGLGLADDIITHLINVGQFRVRPTQAVLRYLGQHPDLQEAGRVLKADSILTGTIRQQPAGFRVTVQLVRVADGNPYWSDTYDLSEQELPGVEDRITEHVSAAIGFPLTRQALARNQLHRAENAAAYEAYLRGRGSMVHGSENGTKAAIAAFQEALRLDADYALAHAGLSMAAAQMHLRFASATDAPAWRDRALREAERAGELDADLAETHQALADVYGKTEFEWDRVITESHRALQLNPRLELPLAYISRAFYHLGLLDRANERARAALALDPENRSEVLRAAGIASLLSGDFNDATSKLEEVQRLGGKPLSDYYLGLAYYYRGDKARAETMLEELGHAPSASSSQRARAWLAAFLAARNERARATELVKQVTLGYIDHHVAAGLGNAYAQLERPDEALRWLRNAADTGFPCHPWYARDPLLQPLRGTPVFESWLQELLLRQREAEKQYARY
jgi:serine/threonine protein kinase/tetratricopeptide (TPR) repeat protein